MYTRLDVVLLGQMATRASVGLYTASYRPVNMVVSVGATLAGTLFPLMARSSPGATPVAFTRAVRGASVIAPAVALGLSGAGALVLRLLFGAEFAAGAPVLTLLAWSAVANWWYAPIAVTLQATGHERAWLSCLLVGILVNAGANAWAIPQWGAVGAAGATLVSEWLLLLLGVGMMSRLQSIRLPGRPVAASVLSITLGAAVLLASHGLGPWLSTTAALGAYTAATIACRSVTMDDVRMVVGWMGEQRRR
jgi:O-antigen/teichoic acid export membrane protein